MDQNTVNTILASGLQMVALTTALTEAIKPAICGDNDALRQRFGPLISVVVGVMLALLGASAINVQWQLAVLAGFANGVGVTYAYRSAKRLAARRVRQRPPRRHALVREAHDA